MIRINDYDLQNKSNKRDCLFFYLKNLKFYFYYFNVNLDKYSKKMHSAAYTYPDGSSYTGEWNADGQRDGFGVLTLTDGTIYSGEFRDGLCDGLGVMVFADGSKYEGQFSQGRYHNLGVFTRCDKMKYEGEFHQGKVNGLGLMVINLALLASK